MIKSLYDERVFIKGKQEAEKEAEEKANKKAYEDKLEIAKSLLDVLDIETVSERFGITIEEIKRD